ncbi:Polyisoprenoid-binding protein YceI [Dysgonomonas macrotermitis]|uniref:Polyisoprenoid-binding protein YceI n=2 Tax=Dysgonomonas macrotermitis TaxID=1346286 RepID=A0A1M5AUJ5_9BACT|nr:Polyisoprenoid-binding protein YceI [Dysgonomonas macrotermitis]
MYCVYKVILDTKPLGRNMRNIYWISLISLLFVCSCKEKKQTEVVPVAEENGISLKVDTAASIIYWKGFGPKTEHSGTLKLKEGIITVVGNNVKLGGFIIDMNTIKCTSITDAANNKKLVTHLNRGDFFNVARYPEARFTIYNSTEIKSDSLTHRLNGALELIGMEKGVTFDAKITKNGDTYKAITAPFNIDRTLWGIKYGSNTVYDAMQNSIVEDNIQIQVVITARLESTDLK